MNPYDANTHPGEHLVAETLGDAGVSALTIANHPDEPLHRAATQMIGAAHDLDVQHDRVTDAAQKALRVLEPVGRGELRGGRVSYALLRTAVPEIGDLLARQDRAYDQLVEAISSYHRLLPAADAAQRPTTNEPSQAQGPGGDDDWAIAGFRLREALESVEAGGLRLCRTAIGEDPYLSGGTDLRPQPLAMTVQRLIADGLLQQDTRENPYRAGQLLSLTPQGEAALLEARTAAPRVSAALSRSNAPANPGTFADSAVLPVTTVISRPSRSR
ncbi:large ATP-binding protein [Streptomyces sp. NPDC048208]|uniref:large ATP-binding protein n=1 Tax=Streptomyces sp. NPDC048208 TaxID=3365515 RepID=UPI0037222C68